MDEVVALCKRRGLIFPASEIYGGIHNTYDYGHYGVLLKRNVTDAWWQAMIQERDDIVALDSAIIQHPRTWEASGHLAGFSDPLVQCLGKCKRRFRLDHLQEEAEEREDQRSSARCAAATCREPRAFNLMFQTNIGPVQDEGSTVFLRPETAQGIFLDFKVTLQYARKKPPFGIAQVGKSFRNEITPGNFIFRTLEFEQMEMEFFVPPDEAQQWYEYWCQERLDWYTRLGIARRAPAAARARRRGALALLVRHQRRRVPVPDRLVGARGRRQPRQLRPHPARAVLAREARVEGPADRPGLPPARDRAGRRPRPDVLALLCEAYDTDEIGGEQRTVLRLHPSMAPIKVAVLPLLRKDGHPEKAREIYEDLRRRMSAEYDEGGNIGKRYRRQDEIGTPFAVTIDHQTLEDDTVTLRDRDSLAQERVAVAELADELERRVTNRT